MDSRERLVASLAHREPDRVPVDLGGIVTGITTGASQALRARLRIEGPQLLADRVQQLAQPHPSILERLRVDTRYLYLSASRDWQDIELDDGIYLCSIATMYRLLTVAGENRARRRQRTHSGPTWASSASRPRRSARYASSTARASPLTPSSMWRP